MWVEDVFTIRGQGTVITGIPSRGMAKVGDVLRLLPCGLTGRVRQMQVYGENSVEGRAGECVALNIPEIDHLQVKRGMPITTRSERMAIVKSVLSSCFKFIQKPQRTIGDQINRVKGKAE